MGFDISLVVNIFPLDLSFVLFIGVSLTIIYSECINIDYQVTIRDLLVNSGNPLEQAHYFGQYQNCNKISGFQKSDI